MNDPSATPPLRWRYGVYPGATGMKIRSLGRVDLPLGEALRLEIVDADLGGEDVVYLQYYISTEAGGWALWTSCPSGDLADNDAALHGMVPPVVGEH